MYARAVEAYGRPGAMVPADPALAETLIEYLVATRCVPEDAYRERSLALISESLGELRRIAALGTTTRVSYWKTLRALAHSLDVGPTVDGALAEVLDTLRATPHGERYRLDELAEILAVPQTEKVDFAAVITSQRPKPR
jgi:hypothetical protein